MTLPQILLLIPLICTTTVLSLRPTFLKRVMSNIVVGATYVPSEFKISEIKSRIPISRIIKQLASQWNDLGNNRFTCICPFHNDVNPSMHVNDDKGLFHCFACGAGGDVINFIQKLEGIPSFEACSRIYSMIGEPALFSMGVPQQEHPEKREVAAALQEASLFYSQYLWTMSEASQARTYLKLRKISMETAVRYRLGYACAGLRSRALTSPDCLCHSVLEHLSNKEIGVDVILKAGLAVQRNRESESSPAPAVQRPYESFRNRLMIPIQDISGKVVAFGGRLLEESATAARGGGKQPYNPKYLNSAENCLFKKGKTLFGLHIAKSFISKADHSVLVEGYFDVLSLHEMGVKNSVGSLGTAVSLDQIATLARSCSSRKVIVLMDLDAAGQIAAQRLCDRMLQYNFSTPVDLRIASLKDVSILSSDADSKMVPKDCGDILSMTADPQHGAALVREALSRAVDWKHWMVDRIMDSEMAETEQTDTMGPSCLQDNPGQLIRIQKRLSSWLLLLQSPAERVLLGAYCAKRLAGGREVIQKRLEVEILSML